MSLGKKIMIFVEVWLFGFVCGVLSCLLMSYLNRGL